VLLIPAGADADLDHNLVSLKAEVKLYMSSVLVCILKHIYYLVNCLVHVRFSRTTLWCVV